MTNKTLAIEAVKRMPNKATLDEIAEELAILAGIQRGREDIAAGRFVTDDEFGRIVDSWFSKSTAPKRPSKKSKPTSRKPRQLMRRR